MTITGYDPAINSFDIGSKDATIALVSMYLWGEKFEADGTAKRDPQDEYNDEVAVLLAYGRAFEALSNKFLKRANGLIKHADDIRAYREVQKSKPQPVASRTIAAANAKAKTPSLIKKATKRTVALKK